MVFNAVKQRKEKKQDDVIVCKPEFRSIFEDEFSLIGKKGKTMNMMRKNYKLPDPRKKKERKKYDLIQ